MAGSLKPKRLVTYFKPTTGKRVPAQVVSNVGNVATLKLASGATVVGVDLQVNRTTFGTWGYTRFKASP